MASLLATNYIFSSYHSPKKIRASFIDPSNYRSTKGFSNFPNLRNMISIEELMQRREQNSSQTLTTSKCDNQLVLELLTIAEVVADRAEMHAIIGAQRNNWNHLLTGSINSFTLVASLMAGISSIPVARNATVAPQLVAFKIAAMIFFSAAFGMMMIVNMVQPSQLAEEQRKATQLWKQLYRSIRDAVALQAPSESDVKDAMNKVLTLERAYPLPITGMLVKFPNKVKPSRWWPEQKQQPQQQQQQTDLIFLERNGWSAELEEEMKGLLRVLKSKDEVEYVKKGKVMLDLNKNLARSGPVLTAAAAISSGFIGTIPALGVLPVVLAVLGGSLATIVNTLEHGGQVGMVFEMFRNCAGYYKQLEEEIEYNLGQEDVGKRENGELFRVKVALHLGRSLSELKEFAEYASSTCKDEDIKEFAGKLF